jgi:hypothetical protein
MLIEILLNLIIFNKFLIKDENSQILVPTPKPARQTDQFWIKNYRLQIYNSQGELVISRNLETEGGTYIDISSFSNGLYLFHVLNNNSIIESGKVFSILNS